VARPADRHAPEAAHRQNSDPEIIVDVDDALRAVILAIHWQGGRRPSYGAARHETRKQPHQRCTDADAIALVRRMAGR